MSSWVTYAFEEAWFIALVDDSNVIIREHPIPFPTLPEAERAATRLNKIQNAAVDAEG